MGDARADFEEIVNQEGKKVYNLACKLCGNREEAKDIAQETFFYETFKPRNQELAAPATLR